MPLTAAPIRTWLSLVSTIGVHDVGRNVSSGEYEWTGTVPFEEMPRARNPEQIALSILAEMVAAKNGVETLTRHAAARVPTPA